MARALTVGQVAKIAGVNVETIRYYQRRGLIAEPKKLLEGYRTYPPETVSRIRFIKRAQSLGFTLAETNGLLRFEGGRVCARTRALAEQKVETIDQKLRDLAAMRMVLGDLIRRCEDGAPGGGCPIIEVLSEGGTESLPMTAPVGQVRK
jgi:MerR family mercuric resistance operon transcriptional regulator